MRWIEKPRHERQNDVYELTQKIFEDSPDRFWLSGDQDGPDQQIMNILLPAGEDIYYNIVMMTAQLKASRMAAYSLGQLPGERLAITPALLNSLGMLNQELFILDHESEKGIGLEIVLNVKGLTHAVIDEVLGRFIDNGQIPLQMRPINPYDLVSRMAKAREEKQHDNYPI